MGNLLVQTVIKVLLGVVLMAALLFLPSGTFASWNAWLLMGILLIPMLAVSAVLIIKSPELLRKRLNTTERESEQKSVIVLSALMFIGGFIVAGLDFRFGWTYLPHGVSIAAAVVFLLAYALFAEVLRENAYLSRTVEVQEGQKVVDTGLYGIVRHPMYLATAILFLMMPLVLGSLLAFLIFLIYPALIAKRIKNEERVLEEGLQGYTEYKLRVRYKVIPFIW